MYDHLIVGTGLYGAVCAHELNRSGKKTLVIDKRPHVGGNIYTENINGINVHKYGAHIFHTNDRRIWEYICSFAEFNGFINTPVANYRGELYPLPFNMNTFSRMWGISTPEEARSVIGSEKKEYISDLCLKRGIKEEDFVPENLEEQAICLVGKQIYEKLIKGYTMKQWGRPCSELPAFIINRIPVRFTYDNNYYNDTYQGIPVGGYTRIIEKMLEGSEVRLNTDFLDPDIRGDLESKAPNIIFTGPIDAYFGYSLGALGYRSLRFETETLDMPDFQGNAVVNYTDPDTPFTRIIEHKWFEQGVDRSGQIAPDPPKTVISREFSLEWRPGEEPYYPVNDTKNNALYEKYRELAKEKKNVRFGGRLGEYRYADMDRIIADALDFVESLTCS